MLMKVKLTKKCWCGAKGDEKEINVRYGRQLISDGYAIEVKADRDARKASDKAKQQRQNEAFKARDRGRKKVSSADVENKSLSAAG